MGGRVLTMMVPAISGAGSFQVSVELDVLGNDVHDVLGNLTAGMGQ
jgi:hypothetical protein